MPSHKASSWWSRAGGLDDDNIIIRKGIRGEKRKVWKVDMKKGWEVGNAFLIFLSWEYRVGGVSVYILVNLVIPLPVEKSSSFPLHLSPRCAGVGHIKQVGT